MNEFGEGKKIINPMSIISFFLFLNFLYVAILGFGRSPIIFFAIFSASIPETYDIDSTDSSARGTSNNRILDVWFFRQHVIK